MRLRYNTGYKILPTKALPVLEGLIVPLSDLDSQRWLKVLWRPFLFPRPPYSSRQTNSSATWDHKEDGAETDSTEVQDLHSPGSKTGTRKNRFYLFI